MAEPELVTGASILRMVPWTRTIEQDGTVTFIAGSRLVRYSGGATRLLPFLLPRLDGRSDLDSIVAELGLPQVAGPVIALCRRLHADGLATVLDAPDDRPVELFDAIAGRTADPVRLLVVATEDEYSAVVNTAPQRWRLSAVPLAGLAARQWDEQTCAVVWVHDPNDPELLDWNEWAYRARLPWLPIGYFDGEAAVVGPHIEPPQTACFECYRRRRASHHPAGEATLAAHPIAAHPIAEVPLGTRAVVHVLAALGMAMLHDRVARRSPFVPGAVRTVTFDEGLQVGTEYVLRVPRCGACRPVAASGRAAPWSEYLAGGDG